MHGRTSGPPPKHSGGKHESKAPLKRRETWPLQSGTSVKTLTVCSSDGDEINADNPAIKI